MKWLLVAIIAVCNTLGDVLNTAGMKRQGEVEDLKPWRAGYASLLIPQGFNGIEP